MDIPDALKQLVTRSTVTFQSSRYLVGEVRKKAAKIDADRRQKRLARYERKPRLLPVDKNEHHGGMEITPWELLHTLGRATVLAGQGSSRALSQHWSCLKYITTLQSNYQGRMELSVEGNDPKYHRKTVQAEDLGIAFALVAALRIVQARHPDYRFEVVDADVTLEAGWALRGAGIKTRENTRLRPDYFLVGVKQGEPVRIVTVECKGSHDRRAAAQHEQLSRAAAQVNAIVVGDAGKDAASPPSLLMATALAGRGGIEMRILDPDGDGELVVPGDRPLSLNGPVEEHNDLAAIPVVAPDGSRDSRPGFYIPPERSEWFSRVLTRTAAASLLAFIGDRIAARDLLTPRQQRRIGAEYTYPGMTVQRDTGITLGGLSFVGTDHVFRFGAQRMEAFSGMLDGLHGIVGVNRDLEGYQSALPQVLEEWTRRRSDVEDDWGGAVAMDNDGAVLGLRAMGAGRKDLQWRRTE